MTNLRNLGSKLKKLTWASVAAAFLVALPLSAQAQISVAVDDDGASVGGSFGESTTASASLESGDGTTGSSVSLGLGGATGDGDVNLGGGSGTASASLGLGGSTGEAGFGLGGGSGDLNLGLSFGGDGTGDPGASGGGGGGGVPPANQIASAIGGLSSPEVRLLQLRCRDVLASPASYPAADVLVCRVVRDLY